tara:strand:+ start:109 stop:597 length:489 start_codon:yes stop_codon:yes gene_type:complete
MAYKNPNDPEVLQKRVEADFIYMNTERGFIMTCISRKFKPSVVKYGGHIAHESMDKKEMWRLYMNHIIAMKEKFPESDGRLCRYCEQPFTFETKMGTRGKGPNHNRGTQNYNNFSIDRYDPRITYQSDNIIFCCVGCNDRKKNSTPEDWKNFLRVGKEFRSD